jgi:flagellar biosynthesis protein FliP
MKNKIVSGIGAFLIIGFVGVSVAQAATTPAMAPISTTEAKPVEAAMKAPAMKKVMMKKAMKKEGKKVMMKKSMKKAMKKEMSKDVTAPAKTAPAMNTTTPAANR